MTSQELYKVSVYYSQMPFPFTPFVHCYVVTEHNNTFNRYEVFHPHTMGDHPSKLIGHVYKNTLDPSQGLNTYISHNDTGDLHRFIGKPYSTASGTLGSPAQTLYQLINSPQLSSYPHAHNYRMILGPNSNSFIQWIINQVPDTDLTLPFNAWGKNFHHD